MKIINKNLFLEAWCGDLNRVKKLVEDGVDLNIKSSTGGTVLMEATSAGRLEMTKYLIELGVDINARDEDGYNALFYAIKYDHPLEVAKYLIELGSDLDIGSPYGSISLAQKYRETIKLLTDNKH